MRTISCLLLFTLAALPPALRSAEPAAAKEKAAAAEGMVTGHRSVEVGGRTLQYQYEAGSLVLEDDKGKQKARIFHVAYTLLDVKDPSTRPLTFVFNGGPGSSSVWLHLGAFGPRKVVMPPDGSAPPPPYKLEDNPYTLLDLTDLVFIDPVSTGYSRAAPGTEPKEFHGVQQDIASVADFIRLYTTRKGRWLSPKLLAGESYGTTRAAGLVAELQDTHGMAINGVMLISSVLDFQTIRFDQGNDLAHVLFLPSYTATAWYHGKLAPPLQEDLSRALKEAESFALEEYSVALLKGSRLTAEESKTIGEKLSRLTGISETYLRRCRLRLNSSQFRKELLRDRERTVGRFDSTLTGVDKEAAGDGPDSDPSYSAIQGCYTAAINSYLRDELGYRSDMPYEVLTGKVQPWDYGSAKNRYLDVSGRLRQAMLENRYLHVFVASGYLDLATPYFATDHTFSHLTLAPSLEGRVSMSYYEAGHMMYTHRKHHARLKEDLARFFQKAARPARAAQAEGRGDR